LGFSLSNHSGPRPRRWFIGTAREREMAPNFAAPNKTEEFLQVNTQDCRSEESGWGANEAGQPVLEPGEEIKKRTVV
jgi:hypothetical protein